MNHRGGVDLKTCLSVMGKSHHANIGITEAKGLFAPVNLVLGQETSWVNLALFTALKQSVDVMRKLLQEAAAEPTEFTELMPGDPVYMAFIDASGEG